MRYSLLVLIILNISLKVSAQDTLFTAKGSAPVYIYHQNDLSVRFYIIKDGDTIRRSIRTSHIRQIAYADGSYWKKVSEQRMENIRAMRNPRMPYQPKGAANVFNMFVPAFTCVGSMPGMSLGLGYERFVDQPGHFSISVSANYFLCADNFHKSGSRTDLNGYFIAPGALYHFRGNAVKRDFAIGLSFPVGQFSRVKNYDDQLGYNHSERTDESLMAILANFSLTRHTSRAFQTTFFASAGFMKPTASTSGLTAQVGISLGVRH